MHFYTLDLQQLPIIIIIMQYRNQKRKGLTMDIYMVKSSSVLSEFSLLTRNGSKVWTARMSNDLGKHNTHQGIQMWGVFIVSTISHKYICYGNDTPVCPWSQKHSMSGIYSVAAFRAIKKRLISFYLWYLWSGLSVMKNSLPFFIWPLQ